MKLLFLNKLISDVKTVKPLLLLHPLDFTCGIRTDLVLQVTPICTCRSNGLKADITKMSGKSALLTFLVGKGLQNKEMLLCTMNMMT